MLASRPDIVREDYMNELCTLQDDVPSFQDTEVCWLGQAHAANCVLLWRSTCRAQLAWRSSKLVGILLCNLYFV